nr:hypothetical protein [Microscillaceae bacterium]
MSENWDDEFEDIFRERLSDFEAEPPAEAWAEIATQVQSTRAWWNNWFYYLPIVVLLVGGFFVLMPRSTTKLNSNSIQIQNSDSKTNKNPELADNQVVINKFNSDSKTNKNPE